MPGKSVEVKNFDSPMTVDPKPGPTGVLSRQSITH